MKKLILVPFYLILSIILFSCASVPETTVTNNYVSYRDPGEQFKNLTQITFSEEADFLPVVSSDGKLLLFTSKRDGHTNIYLKKSILSRAVIKKTFSTGIDSDPVFSPDNKKFAFTSDRNGNFDIFITNVNKGSAKTQITNSPANEVQPDWSPNGKMIAFSQYSKIDSRWYIWIKNLESGALTQLGRGNQPKFSFDSRRILYKKYPSNSKTRYTKLWSMDIDGDNDTELTSGDQWGISTYCWSPDGMKILFSSYTKDNDEEFYEPENYDSDLWAMSFDGTELTQLTTHQGRDYSPCWVEVEENYIYFTSDRNGEINIWRFIPVF